MTGSMLGVRRSQGAQLACSAFFMLFSLALALPSHAADVFFGDPVDGSGVPYAMLPGFPLILPDPGTDPAQPNTAWSSGTPSIDASSIGDVDLVARCGSIAEVTIPAPAGAGGSALPSVVAGGGSTGQGGEAPFTVMVTDGPGTTVYGQVLASELEGRPAAVFAFADLDGDGRLGPTDADAAGASDNGLEEQEVLRHVGKQVGIVSAGRLSGTLGVRLAAPASMGGLTIGLVAGAYSGFDRDVLWSDGPPVFTRWPFFPPLDPGLVLMHPGPDPLPPLPDPEGVSEIFFDSAEHLRTAPGHAVLGDLFALPLDGSEPSTDQLVAVSGPASGAALFDSRDPAAFTADVGRDIRVAPAALVPPPGSDDMDFVEAVTTLGFSGAGVARSFRLLPVDGLGNVADPDGGGLALSLVASGNLEIVSVDAAAVSDPGSHTVTLTSARGVQIELARPSVGDAGLLDIALVGGSRSAGQFGERIVAQVVAARGDTDGDAVGDDGDGSGVAGDNPCAAGDVRAGRACDDNCRLIVNPSQTDSDGDGLGVCCDGTCVNEPGAPGCLECPQAAAFVRSSFDAVRLRLRIRDGLAADTVSLGFRIPLWPGQSFSPAGEAFELSLLVPDRSVYQASLLRAFEPVGRFEPGSMRGSFSYEDRHGAVTGVRRARLRSRAGRGYRGTLRARGTYLVTAPENWSRGLIAHVAIGDDAYTSHLRCGALSRTRVRCTK